MARGNRRNQKFQILKRNRKHDCDNDRLESDVVHHQNQKYKRQDGDNNKQETDLVFYQNQKYQILKKEQGT